MQWTRVGTLRKVKKHEVHQQTELKGLGRGGGGISCSHRWGSKHPPSHGGPRSPRGEARGLNAADSPGRGDGPGRIGAGRGRGDALTLF